MFNFKYISAPPGAGKTNYLIDTLAPQIRNRFKSVLVIVPTIDLCDQIVERSGKTFQTLHTKNTGNVGKEILDFMHKDSPCKSLVITEQIFRTISHKISPEKKKNWILIKDEAIDPLEIETLHVPDSKKMISEWIEAYPLGVLDGKYTNLSKIIGLSDKCPKSNTHDDQITGFIKDIADATENPNVEMLIDSDSFSRSSPALRYSLFQLPSLYAGFRDVYFMSANFTHTQLYHQWKTRGVNWQDSTPPEINIPLASERVKFHYCFEEGVWSKSRREHGQDLPKYAEWIHKKIPNDDYIYAINDSTLSLVGGDQFRGTKIPQKSFGMNTWRSSKNFVSVGSYLSNLGEEPFHRFYGTSTNDARILRNAQILFQQITRTSIRNREEVEEINVYLPTLQEVLDLIPYLPKATVMDYRKKSDGVDTGIVAKFRDAEANAKKEPEFESVDFDPNMSAPRYALSECLFSSTPMCVPYENIGNLLDKEGQLAEKGGDTNIYIPGVFGHLLIKNRGGKNRKHQHPFISFIKKWSGPSINISHLSPDDFKSNKLPAFITGYVGPNESFRDQDVIANNDIIAFDFDGSSLELRDISRIFEGIEYYKYTTIKHKDISGLYRFRVVIPCSRMMARSEHHLIMNFFKERIEQYSKVHRRTSGLDARCLSSSRKFFLPHMESQRKHVYKGKVKLDIDGILMRIPVSAKVQGARRSDMEIIESRKDPLAFIKNTPLEKRIDELMDQIQPGNRSTLACRIGGIMGRNQMAPDYKNEIICRMEELGVNKKAIASAKNYAFGNGASQKPKLKGAIANLPSERQRRKAGCLPKANIPVSESTSSMTSLHRLLADPSPMELQVHR